MKVNMKTQSQPASTMNVSHPSDNPTSIVLSDDALTAAGLRRVSAFIRTEKSANAKRIIKSRDAAAQSGMRQVNVRAPSEQHDVLKSFAKELQAVQGARVALENLLSAEVRKTDPSAVVQITNQKALEAEARAIRRLNTIKGWRRLLAKLLGLL